jgi:hypothetical protein
MSITAIVKNYERFLQPKRVFPWPARTFPRINFIKFLNEYNLPAGHRLALRYLAISQHSLSVDLLKQRISWWKEKLMCFFYHGWTQMNTDEDNAIRR